MSREKERYSSLPLIMVPVCRFPVCGMINSGDGTMCQVRRNTPIWVWGSSILKEMIKILTEEENGGMSIVWNLRKTVLQAGFLWNISVGRTGKSRMRCIMELYITGSPAGMRLILPETGRWITLSLRWRSMC